MGTGSLGMHVLGRPSCPRAGRAGEERGGKGPPSALGLSKGEHTVANPARWSGRPFPLRESAQRRGPCPVELRPVDHTVWCQPGLKQGRLEEHGE